MEQLTTMFERQIELARNFIPIDKLLAGESDDAERQKYLIAYVALLLEETVEFSRCLPARKFWRKSIMDKPVKWSEAREELADIVHIVIALALICGMTPRELYEEYIKKNNINIDRVKNNL